MTDPVRLPSPVLAAQKLPPGAAVIYRHFGGDNRHIVAERLRQVTISRGQQLLIGHDPDLAIACGADGVHFRRDPQIGLPALWRRRCPDWIVTMAGMKNDESYEGLTSAVDALFVSSVFPSQSPSSGVPIGIKKLTAICSSSAVPVIALGGVNSRTAERLIGSGAAGLAGISGI